VVKGFSNRKETGIHRLTTAGQAASITAVSDKQQFRVNKKELAHIEMTVLDSKGNLVYDAVNEVTISIDGPARLLGLESGDLASHEDYKSNKRKVFNGKLLAYIQSNGTSGVVMIKVDSPGLPSTIVTIASTK